MTIVSCRLAKDCNCASDFSSKLCWSLYRTRCRPTFVYGVWHRLVVRTFLNTTECMRWLAGVGLQTWYQHICFNENCHQATTPSSTSWAIEARRAAIETAVRKSYIIYHLAPLTMTLTDYWRSFQRFMVNINIYKITSGTRALKRPCLCSLYPPLCSPRTWSLRARKSTSMLRGWAHSSALILHRRISK